MRTTTKTEGPHPPWMMPLLSAATFAASTAFYLYINRCKNKEEDCDTPSWRRRRTLDDDMTQSSDGTIALRPIGVVHSVYSLCVGTPRQGLLAPDARGRIELDSATPWNADDAVDGLAEYSHVWIQFVFHLNTVGKSNTNDSNNNNNNNRRLTTKIAPPALGGRRKVGVLATRSPHRPNPVGLTLAKLDRIVTESRRNQGQVTCLYLSGLDLVDGTPVLDVKPFVPAYDAVASPADAVTVPSWVSRGLQTRRTVTFDPSSLGQLAAILQTRYLRFYGRDERTRVQAAIQQVLSVDVRSAWQTRKARQGQFQAERSQRLAQLQMLTEKDESDVHKGNTTCTQQLDNLLIHYTVRTADQQKRVESAGSGAEDVVHVTAIQYYGPSIRA